MVLIYVILISSFASLTWAVNLNFPHNFKFGVATASYQIEGAWNVSDKSENIWDSFTHNNPTAIKDGSNGDRACDSYHQWKRDVEMASEMNVHFYRFSMSWSRLLPTGFDNYISEDGKNYYSNLIDELLRKGIEPVVTLYHWDLPKTLQDLGGWANPLIVKWFTEYAKVAFNLYGSRVKTWITINEPLIMCDVAYVTGSMAPGLREPLYGPSLCARHVLLAHASAYRLYHSEFRFDCNSTSNNSGKGKISIANHIIHFYPQTEKDIQATELVTEYVNGRYIHPVYSREGGWSRNIERLIDSSSVNQGYTCSRLPPFTEQEKIFIKGTYDFFAVNYYLTKMVRQATERDLSLGYFLQIPELNAALFDPPNSTTGYVKSQPIYPEGLRKTMNWIRDNYGDVEIFITENGYSTEGSHLRDTARIKYIEDHLEQVLLSIHEDKIKVQAYTYWSLLDNFEWSEGYLARFGLYETDYNDKYVKRTPKESAFCYGNIIRNKRLGV